MTKRRKALTVLSSAAVLAIGVAVLLLLTSFKAEAIKTEQTADIRTVKTRLLIPGPQIISLSSEGFLQPVRSLDLYSSMPGRVTLSLNGLESGTNVVEGDLLLALDDRRARLGFENARSELISSVSLFMGAAGMDDVSREAWSRYLADLHSADFNKLPELPASNHRLSLLSATMGVSSAGHHFESAALDLSDHQLRAPFSGTLTGPGVLEESQVSPGMVLATLVDTGRLELPLSIPAEQLNFVAIGDTVTISRRGSDSRLEGTLLRIDPILNPGSQSAGVIALFDNTEEADWLPGSYVKASIRGRRFDSAYRVPRGLLVNEQLLVYSDGYLQLLSVGILARDGDDVLLAADIPEGTEIVETVLQNPIHGLPLRKEDF